MTSNAGRLLVVVAACVALGLCLGLGLLGSPGSAAGPLAAEFSVPLRPGWNLVSIPFPPASTAITDVLQPIAGQYDLVYAYRCDGCGQLVEAVQRGRAGGVERPRGDGVRQG